MNLRSGTFLFCTTQQMGDWAPNGKDKYSNGCFQSDSLRTRSLSTVLHCPLECFSHPKGYKRDQLDPLWAFVEFLRFGFIFFFLQALGDSCTEQSELLPHCRKPRGARVLECAWLLSCVPPFLPIPCLTVEATCGTIPVCALSHLCISVRPMALVGVRTYNACCSKAIPASSSVDRIPSLPPSLPAVQLRARTFAFPALQWGLLSPFFFLGEVKGGELPATQSAFGSCFLPMCIYAICKYAIYMCQQVDLCHLF